MSIPCSEAKYDTNGMWYVSLDQIRARHTNKEFRQFQKWHNSRVLLEEGRELVVYLYDYEEWLRSLESNKES
ncbi:hypothetical protein LCGC14_1286430 [marine sediment metagenome]|uniref:Uncharacterized protein n=1 Tax=marine sediment metagenome TaxID=412755 RepID=A0A0F9LEN1_9ZZZZ